MAPHRFFLSVPCDRMSGDEKEKYVKKLCGTSAELLLMLCSDCAGNFTGTQAPGTNIHMARRTIDQSLYALDVGLPGTIGTTMRVGNLDTEGHALIAELALSHPLHLLAVVTSCLRSFASSSYHTRSCRKMQALLDKKLKKFSEGKVAKCRRIRYNIIYITI